MDNVTHSLIGALLSEATRPRTASTEGRQTSGFRSISLFASVLANNLPDFDFVYRRVTAGKLGYLLHHRGHTHTVPGAIGAGALTLLLSVGYAKLRRRPLSRYERGVLSGLSFAGPLVHIGLDYTNNYGVHPFWPLDDSWYYGDSVFIVEPALWAVALPALALLSTSLVTRAVAVALFVIALWFGGSTGALSLAQELTLAGLAAGMTLLCARTRPEARAFMGIAAWLATTLVFVAEGRNARAQARTATAREFPTTRIVDLVTTPRPADPFCWSALILGTEGDRYVVRRAVVSTSRWRRACASFDGLTSTAAFARLSVEDGGVRFEREFVQPISELRKLANKSCTARAFLRYSRAPFWTSDRPPVVGDLRFDRSRALEFTEFPLPEPDDVCPRNVPPWTPPRSDLLQ